MGFDIVTERTICFLINKDKILLGMKKRGQGSGNYNGFGGGIEKGETPEEGAVREIFEESGLTVLTKDLDKMALIDFHFPYKTEWNQRVHVYFVNSWKGEPTETEEMKPKWFNIKDLPYNNMWESDRHWLPIILGGNKINAFFTWKEDNKSVADYKIEERINF